MSFLESLNKTQRMLSLDRQILKSTFLVPIAKLKTTRAWAQAFPCWDEARQTQQAHLSSEERFWWTYWIEGSRVLVVDVNLKIEVILGKCASLLESWNNQQVPWNTLLQIFLPKFKKQQRSNQSKNCRCRFGRRRWSNWHKKERRVLFFFLLLNYAKNAHMSGCFVRARSELSTRTHTHTLSFSLSLSSTFPFSLSLP